MVKKGELENWNDLSDEEKARLASKTPIAKDDFTAICTAAGWARYKSTAEVMRKRHEADPDVERARLWRCVPRQPRSRAREIFVECEHRQDAVRVATRLYGVDADVVLFDDVTPKPARVQARWTGSAMGGTPDLRLQTRRVDRRGKVGRWEDLR